MSPKNSKRNLAVTANKIIRRIMKRIVYRQISILWTSMLNEIYMRLGPDAPEYFREDLYSMSSRVEAEFRDAGIFLCPIWGQGENGQKIWIGWKHNSDTEAGKAENAGEILRELERFRGIERRTRGRITAAIHEERLVPEILTVSKTVIYAIDQRGPELDKAEEKLKENGGKLALGEADKKTARIKKTGWIHLE